VRFSRRFAQPVTNQFGTLMLDVIRPARLMVPTAKSLDGIPPPLTPSIDHFACYKIKYTSGSARFARRTVTIDTQLETGVVLDVIKPLRLCVPVSKNGEPLVDGERDLLCYRVRSRTSIANTPVFVDNQFGTDTFRVGQRREFCVPSNQPPPYGSPSRAFLRPSGDLLD